MVDITFQYPENLGIDQHWDEPSIAQIFERARREPAGSRQNINISYLQTGKTSELKWIFHCNACSP
jgi:hypothetical protein